MTKDNVLMSKIEIVQNLKNEIPSYEEFLETYEVNELVVESYNLENNTGEKGYGPCIINGQFNYDNCHCSSEELDRQLKIIRNKKELEASEREKSERERRERELVEKERKERIAKEELEKTKLRMEEDRRRALQDLQEKKAKSLETVWKGTFGW